MKSIFALSALLFSCLALAQTAPSDSLFNTDQVVTIDLTFDDPDFWSTLTTYYTNDVGETLTADVNITDNTGTHTYPQVEVDLKGNSSYGHPGNKKSFKIDFNDNISGQKYHGMTKVHLNNCFKDPTFMREKIFFDFSREQGVLAPRVSYANVTMNGTFWGFYDLVEPVDKNFLDRWVDDNDGNLFKAGDNFGGGPGGGSNPADLAYYGEEQSGYSERYELKTNETENDWSDLIVLLEELNNASDDQLVAEFRGKWEWETILRSLAIDNVFSNLDSYINSARNYYVYHDSITFKWTWIKWDANEAFGSYGGQGVGNLLNLSPSYVASSRPLMTKIMGIPAFYDDYVVQYCSVLDGFSNADMDAHIDAIRTLIEPHVAADGNKQYTTAQFSTNVESNITTGGGPGGGTIYGLKSFITERSGYLSGTLPCETVGLPHQSTDLNFSVFPNPTTGPVHVRCSFPLVQADVMLMDGIGRTMRLERTGNKLDITHLAPGTYILRVSLGDTGYCERVVKY